jgi:DNA-binding Lrp family transcriptional regulator
MNNKTIDNTDRELIIALQKGLPITSRPYKEVANRFKLSEDDVIARVSKLKSMELIKRIDFRLDLKKAGVATTLIACKIPEDKIQDAKNIILNCKNVSHNYLRKHDFNMWFTLSADSAEKLDELLTDLKNKLDAEGFLSFPTKNVFKLGFRLNVK